MVKAAALALTLAPVRLPVVAPATPLTAPVLAVPNTALPSAKTSLPMPAVAQVLKAAPNRPTALASLKAMGAVAEKDAPASGADEALFWSNLWDASGGSRHEVDASWDVPAVVVENGGVSYYIHPVAHGSLMPHRRGAVARLAKAVEARGAALYWEQNLPAFYGVTRGTELRDHAAMSGGAVETLPADRPETRRASWRRRLEAAAVYAAPAAAAAWALTSPQDVAAWLLLAAFGAFAWAAATSLRPLRRLAHLRSAWEAERAGFAGLAGRLYREAAVYFAPRLDARELGRLEAPLPLADAADPVVRRSVAMAEAVRASGAKEVHLVAGYRHAYHAADRLAGLGPK